MDLIKYLARESVFVLENPITRDELIRMLCQSLKHSPALADEPPARIDEVIAAVMEREAAAPTGLGNGFAFPHARLSFLRRPAMALAVLRKPVDFCAPDEQPATIVGLVIAPEQNPTIALKIMSLCCRAFSHLKTHDALKAAGHPEELHKLVAGLKIELDVSITARDIMREPNRQVHPDTPLREVTAIMTKNTLHSIAVLTEEQKIVGQITCPRLFNFGLPDFFAQLKSVSFIKEFDPFEKYFYEEANSKASDIMTDDFHVVAPNATLLEVVFALTTLRHQKIFVVENEKLVGMIDQSAVLDQIINF